MQAPDNIKKLVTHFHANIDQYKLGNYNETQLRIEFINPLFAALGWDIDNKQGYAAPYKDVIHEYSLRSGSSTKAPDYCFRAGGQNKFFLETKKPATNIKQDIAPAFQVRSYGWSAKLSLSILSDFEEFAVYDCQVKPKATDSASIARLFYYNYQDYVTKWEEIAALFSKQAVYQGSFDRYAIAAKKTKGTFPVDQAFLKEMEGWRELLAKNIALRNETLTQKELNHLVQATIDRIVFLRIGEDRAIEPAEQLKNLTNRKDLYKALCELFKNADDQYNSGLFHFKQETGRTIPDNLSLLLNIDDKPLKTIINSLYYPNPYIFSEIPPDILGQVYEQFLGKVIRLTKGHQAKIETKPEVRKAGGVYYTPQYIVHYIVANTVGELLQDKTPKQAKAITILDPACGSGSFLLGAYQYLLDWYRVQYTKSPSHHKKQLYKDQTGGWQLNVQTKKDILLNHIYGVDIDRQAVEVTKLSLLLKVLESENKGTLETQWEMFKERVLPDLSNNIKCGNALIGTDFYKGENLALFGRDEMDKINAFDWDSETGFGKIMQAGGFDCVIGNPPYARLQSLQESQPFAIETYKKLYTSATVGNFDLYALFTEKGYTLLKQNGLLGFIQPHKFMQADFGEGLRNLLSQHKALKKIVHFGAEQIFADATTYTCLLFLNKTKNARFQFIPIEKDIKDNLSTAKGFSLKQPALDHQWHFMHPQKEKVMQKLHAQPQRLADVVRKIFVGLQTSADKIYVLKVIKWHKKNLTCYSKSLDQEIQIEAGLVKPFLMGKDVKRYAEPKPQNVVIFPYDLSQQTPTLMTQKFIKETFPKGWQYLLDNKQALENRERGRFKKSWWQFSRPQNLSEFATTKIMTPDICSYPNFSYDGTATLYHTTTVYSFAFQDDIETNPKFYLGLMNSKVLWFFLKLTGNVLRGDFIRFKTEYLKPFPIPKLDLANKQQKSQHDNMVELVEQMLVTQKDLHGSDTEADRHHHQQRADILDQQINTLVYQLYNLTPTEIEIIQSC